MAPSLSKSKIKKAAATKGLTQEVLPSRHALNEITRGDAVQRSLGNYAKLTPTMPNTGPDIVTLPGKKGRRS